MLGLRWLAVVLQRGRLKEPPNIGFALDVGLADSDLGVRIIEVEDATIRRTLEVEDEVVVFISNCTFISIQPTTGGHFEERHTVGRPVGIWIVW